MVTKLKKNKNYYPLNKLCILNKTNTIYNFEMSFLYCFLNFILMVVNYTLIFGFKII